MMDILRKRHSFSGRKHSSSAQVSLLSPKLPAKREGWAEESMQAAIKAVEEGLM